MKFTANIPRPTRARLDLDAIADELRAHPGEWAAIEKGERGRLNAKAYLWRNGKVRAFPLGEFEFTTRAAKKKSAGLPHGEVRVKLYGRYVGESLTSAID